MHCSSQTEYLGLLHHQNIWSNVDISHINSNNMWICHLHKDILQTGTEQKKKIQISLSEIFVINNLLNLP